MTAAPTNIYGDSTFRNVDVGAIMRDGHPDIAEGDQLIGDLIDRRRKDTGRPLTIMDVGSGSGVLSEQLAERFPDCRVIANDNAPSNADKARARLAALPNAEVFDRSFEEWVEPLDVVISWGTHHHMPHTYLDQVRSLLQPGGVLIIGDEFCPEYCTAEDAERILSAEVLQVVDGYVMTNNDDITALRETHQLPQWSRDLEERRQRALWTWYKFVIDYALDRDCWLVALAELQITKDDMTTSFEEEHKLSPLLVERELRIAGYAQDAKHVIGDRPTELQSFYVYEYTPENR